MLLCLVHHGDAVGPDTDPQRPLSTRGRIEVEQLAARAAARGVKPAVIWHSGKLRAKQTAEAFWRSCNPLSTFSSARGLQPSDPVSWIADSVVGDAREILLVGHFPHLPRLLAFLLTGDSEAAPADFPAHGMVAVEEIDGKWEEKWRL